MAKSRRFRIGPEPLDRAEMKRWMEVQVPYPNLATDDEIGKRAAHYAETQVQHFMSRTHQIRDKWETLDYMLRGNTLSNMFPDSDLHVPVLYMMEETLVPRIVEAILSQDPWFQVQGRDRHDRMRARKLQNWLRYQSDVTKLEPRMEEVIRTMLRYQFVALKTRWDVRYRKRISKVYDTSVGDDGLPVYDITHEDVDELVYESNAFDVVDPYLFVCDTRCTSVDDMLYVGDVTFMSEDEIERLGNMGVYENVDKVLEKARQTNWAPQASLTARASISHRSMTDDGFHFNNRRIEGQPGRLEVSELWCKWRRDEDDEWDEWVITSCGSIPLRVQKNPYDDKHRPYVVARAAKEPFDFFNVGVLDHGIRLNMEIDDHRNLARKSHALSLAPVTWLDTGTDAPNNIFDIDPGQILRGGSQPPSFIKVPSTVGDMIPFEAVLRRDIEKVTGAPEIFDGGGNSNTATETERKIQEGNRRIRRLVFSASDMLEDLLVQWLSNTKQFVTTRKPFRVVGADARALNLDETVSPEDFVDPVDIIITGPRRLQSYGLRATQVTSFINQVGPFLPMLVQQGNLNVEALVSEMWESIVGHRLGEEILNIPKSADDAMLPADENMLLGLGAAVEVHPLDNDEKHIAGHLAYAESAKDKSAKERALMHVKDHLVQRQQKAARESSQENSPRGPFASGQVIDGRQKGGEGRGYQPTPDLQGDVTRTNPPRETPGPARLGSQPAPDREPPVPQTGNR